MMKTTYFIALATGFLIAPLFGEELRSPTVGIAGRIEQIVLPGTELIARPIEDDSSPVVLRIDAVFPHGTANRYDLEFYGLEPGKFDLRDYLLRKDGSGTSDLPEIPVEIRGILGPGQKQPNPLPLTALPVLGGYRALLAAAAILWLVGLLALIFIRPKKQQPQDDEGKQKLSLAERLRPIVERAQTGELSKNEQAELERLLIGYWRERLNLEGQSMTDALATLRQHDEAGALLGALEEWLHSPNHGEGIDVSTLLKPYENVRVEP
ncbi:MAG: hypothetical protein KDN22_15370 [Verrucomicrobiae bacterium]|nr:hypothetical protein [Verrucomicrobiae bacterium]